MTEEEEGSILEADAFVHPIYKPKDVKTGNSVTEFLTLLGLSKRKGYLEALSSFIVACKTAAGKGGHLIAFPGSKHYYTGSLFGLDVAVKVRSALIKHDFLKLIERPRKGQSAVYRFDGVDLVGNFGSRESWPVRVREKKVLPHQQRGRLMTGNECVNKFQGRYRDAVCRVKKINKVYEAHPLVSPEGISWNGVHRVFNNGRLDRGGRLYGAWQQLKEEKRLTLSIDGDRVAEIDITACFLFITSALSGCHVVSQDPYKEVSWVKSKETRDLAKRLVSSIISTDGPLKQFPRGMRDEFGIPKKAHLKEYQEPILEAYPFLKSPKVGGMEIMYRESEVIFKTIEDLSEEGITAYPVHDCLIVREKDWKRTSSKLLENLKCYFGARPWLTVGLDGEKKFELDPVTLTVIRR